jgi:hypothetical protein
MTSVSGPKPEEQATPAATGEAHVSVTITETSDRHSSTRTYSGTVSQVIAAISAYQIFISEGDS